MITIDKKGVNFSHSKMELIPDNDCEIIIEDGKCFIVRKQSKYPKTYEECCRIMGIEYPFIKKHEDAITASCYKNDLITDFIYLLICRDAYWKIAGNWKPDWENVHTNHYTIVVFGNGFGKEFNGYSNRILVFPTAEMRNAFYENFKDLIEKCKELL